jgi:putative ABC transport system permease protein
MRDDFRNAFRSLRFSPTFTALALTVLALGIGAGTAIFSVVDAVVLRGLPFHEHDRLVAVLEHDTRRPTTFGGGQTTPQTYLDWRLMQESFEAIAGAGSYGVLRMRNEAGEPIDGRGLRVTHEFFQVFRVTPMLGRAFTAEDEIDGRHRVAILSYGYWQRRFGGSPEVIGKRIEVNDQTLEIVGVMPRQFAYPVGVEFPTEVYWPIAFTSDDKVRGSNRNYNWLAIARLKPGVSIEQAHDQMNRVAVALDEQYPKFNPGMRVRVVTLHHHLVGRVREWMLMLLGAVALVLLIACANVANLMLARATVRAREMGIRSALGASRWRLIRGLLVEGVMLSVAGAALGVVLAYAGVQTIRVWLPTGLPRMADIAIDLRVLAAASAAALLTGLFFGVVPAFQSSRPDLARALKDSGRSTTAGTPSQRLRSLLVVAEVALAVVLLVGAGLFIGSFVRLMRIDPGFDYRHVLALSVGVRVTAGHDMRAAWADAEKRGGPYVQQILEAVKVVPGIEAASGVSGGAPLTGSWSRTGVEIPGRLKQEGGSGDNSIDRRIVTPDYLQTLRIPLIRGRDLSPQDTEASQKVVVINETAARKYWPDRDALGQAVRINNQEVTVVGIVGDIRHLGPETPPRQECYMPVAQNGVSGMTLALRTSGDPMALLPAVKAAIWSVNKEQRLSGDVFTLEGYMDRLIAQRRFNMTLLVLFGALGLIIAGIGIYGVMAYIVAQRTGEIGVRMALGATRANVVSMVLKRAGAMMILGLAIGGVVAWYTSAVVRTFLFQTEPNDIRILAAAVATLAAAGLLASAIPARRAASVDPLVALRHE